ncbi:MAG: sigma-70 family RNA polymerase sigma factor [Elusimicrobiota bacterium]
MDSGEIECERLLLSRNPDAVRKLIGRYQRPLFSYLYHRMTDVSAADDVLQEVFVKVWKNRDAYEARGSLAGWLFTIARRTALDHEDKIRRRRTASLDAAEGIGERERYADSAVGPERLADSSAMGARIDAAVAALPEDQREVFLLREYGGLSFAEIARETGCPLGTALARMRYAVLKLRDKLGDLDA